MEERKLPVKRKLEIKMKRRIDRFGELVIDRTLNSDSLQNAFDTQLSLTSTPAERETAFERLVAKNYIKDIDLAQELLLSSIQDQAFKNIYVFSDAEDNTDELDKRYKMLGVEFRNFAKKKRRQTYAKRQQEFIGF